MKLTKQGVRDLNSKQTNARRVRQEDACLHVWEHAPYCDNCAAWWLERIIPCVEACKRCGARRS